MKRVLMLGAAAACLLAAPFFAARAEAADPLTLQLKWVAQAQFAGYYVAAAKGFYKAANLDVTIKPGGPDINPAQVIAGGGADVTVDWLPSALATREKGVKLVNIAQIFTKSGLEMTCRKDTGIRSPEQFKGKTVGVWFFGNEYPFLAWMNKLHISTNGGPDGVTMFKQGFNVDPLLQKQVPCISTMTYNEYWQVIEGGVKPDALQVFKYEDQGVATLEDGLYTTEAKLADPAMADRLVRFVRASIEGWRYAEAHQDEAVKIVMDADTAGGESAAHQKRMMSEIARLAVPASKGMGYLEPAAYQRTVDELMSGGSDPVITKKPEGAFTYAIWEKATAKQ